MAAKQVFGGQHEGGEPAAKVRRTEGKTLKGEQRGLEPDAHLPPAVRMHYMLGGRGDGEGREAEEPENDKYDGQHIPTICEVQTAIAEAVEV